MFQKLNSHCNMAENICTREGGCAIPHFHTKWLPEEKRRKVQLLIVSTRWFLEYWDSSNAGSKHHIRLRASAFIIALPGKTKQSHKPHSKLQKPLTSPEDWCTTRKGAHHRAGEGTNKPVSKPNKPTLQPATASNILSSNSQTGITTSNSV